MSDTPEEQLVIELCPLQSACPVVHAAEEAVEERGFQRGRVERLKSVLPRLYKARSIGYKWGYEEAEEEATKKERERCAEIAESMCRYRSPSRCEMETPQECRGCAIAAAIREGEDG